MNGEGTISEAWNLKIATKYIPTISSILGPLLSLNR